MIVFLAGLIIGTMVGWAWRSIVFGLDQDCANPDHRRAKAPRDQ
jgi:hypothetical protein